ncbi:MAG: hypothetical protein KC544_01935 [Gemmatimonadetes bacterium]|nr:hypothetical protein [Gemmatimonadota bacterium]MCB9504753.1 hypothetical protein [Gemmatimonadales bacterium]
MRAGTGARLGALAVLVFVADRALYRLVAPEDPASRVEDAACLRHPVGDEALLLLGDSQSAPADGSPAWHEVALGPHGAVVCPGRTLAAVVSAAPVAMPDTVIVWAGWNDVMARFRAPARRLPGWLARSGLVQLGRILTRPVRRALRDQGIDRLAQEREGSALPDDERGLDAITAVLEPLAARPGGSLVVVRPPWLGTDAEPEIYHRFLLESSAPLGAYARAHEALGRSLGRFCAAGARVACLPLDSAVAALSPDERATLFLDPLHLSAAGHRWVASWMQAVLEGRGSGAVTAPRLPSTSARSSLSD